MVYGTDITFHHTFNAQPQQGIDNATVMESTQWYSANNARTPPILKYYGHTSSPRIPALYQIQDIDRIKIVDDHDVK